MGAQGLPWAERGLQPGKHNPNKQVRIRKELIVVKEAEIVPVP